MMIRSPSMTVSTLLAPRPFDDIRTGLGLFKTWPMMSVHFWGESVAEANDANDDELDATWYLLVKNGGDRPAVVHDAQASTPSLLKAFCIYEKKNSNIFQMTFYGTSEDPQPGVPIKIVRKEPEKRKQPEAAASSGVVQLDDGVFGVQQIGQGWDFEEGLSLVGVDSDDQIKVEPAEADLPEPKSVDGGEQEELQQQAGIVTLEIDPAQFGAAPVDLDLVDADVALGKSFDDEVLEIAESVKDAEEGVIEAEERSDIDVDALEKLQEAGEEQ